MKWILPLIAIATSLCAESFLLAAGSDGGKILYAKTDIDVYSWPAPDKKTGQKAPLGTAWHVFDYWQRVYGGNGEEFYKVGKSEYVRSADLASAMPAHCSGRLTYRIGLIESNFRAEGYDQEKALKLVQYCEKEWEIALGIDFFEYDPASPNAINFSDYPSTALDSDKDTWGLTEPRTLSNGTAGGFSMIITNAPFLWDITHNKSNASSQHVFTEPLLAGIILHEMGHALGILAHEPKNPDAVMFRSVTFEGKERSFVEMPKLTEDDVKLAKTFCGR